jgi:hypothetical protein
MNSSEPHPSDCLIEPKPKIVVQRSFYKENVQRELSEKSKLIYIPVGKFRLPPNNNSREGFNDAWKRDSDFFPLFLAACDFKEKNKPWEV